MSELITAPGFVNLPNMALLEGHDHAVILLKSQFLKLLPALFDGREVYLDDAILIELARFQVCTPPVDTSVFHEELLVQSVSRYVTFSYFVSKNVFVVIRVSSHSARESLLLCQDNCQVSTVWF